MAKKIATPVAPVVATLYAGKLPNTKKPGETLREKSVRRTLRAAKALDAARAKPAPREGEVDGYAKKFDFQAAKLRERVALDTLAGIDSAAANEFEVAAWKIAAVVVAPAAKKPKAPKTTAPKRRAPAAKKAAPVAEPVAAEEPATAE